MWDFGWILKGKGMGKRVDDMIGVDEGMEGGGLQS